MGDPPSRIAVVGPDDDRTGRVRRAVGDAGGELVDPPSADAIVALGDGGLRDATRRVVDPDGSGGTDHAPVYPLFERSAVPSDGNTGAVDDTVANEGERVDHAVRRLMQGNTRLVSQPILSIDLDDVDTYHATFDVALVTDEPARISEYGIDAPDRRHLTVRSDGVVVATPLGSERYANAAGGPVVAPSAGLAVVPIAPFTTRRDTWVVDGTVTLSVERDAEAVSGVVDGRRRAGVPSGCPVKIGIAARVDLLVDGADPERKAGVDPAPDRKGSNNS